MDDPSLVDHSKGHDPSHVEEVGAQTTQTEALDLSRTTTISLTTIDETINPETINPNRTSSSRSTPQWKKHRKGFPTRSPSLTREDFARSFSRMTRTPDFSWRSRPSMKPRSRETLSFCSQTEDSQPSPRPKTKPSMILEASSLCSTQPAPPDHQESLPSVSMEPSILLQPAKCLLNSLTCLIKSPLTKPIGIIFIFICLGLSFYFYIPNIVSDVAQRNFNTEHFYQTAGNSAAHCFNTNFTLNFTYAQSECFPFSLVFLPMDIRLNGYLDTIYCTSGLRSYGTFRSSPLADCLNSHFSIFVVSSSEILTFFRLAFHCMHVFLSTYGYLLAIFGLISVLIFKFSVIAQIRYLYFVLLVVIVFLFIFAIAP
jgi:hypothetical protein